jgi:hypothetical protein
VFSPNKTLRVLWPHWQSPRFTVGTPVPIWGNDMSLKETMILGAVGAVGIGVARSLSSTTGPLKVIKNNGRVVPGIPPDFMTNPSTPNASWSLAFTLIPAALAYYLSN